MACDICACPEATLVGEKAVPAVQTRTGPVGFWVRLVCCAGCGLVYQDPLQDEEKLAGYYAAAFREEGCRPRDRTGEETRGRVSFVRSLLKAGSGASILEVGCADGTTLAGLRELGLATQGIEPSRENAAACRARGLTVHEGPYERMDGALDAIDLIASYYVMEHLRSPVHFLTFCNRALRPGGTLVLEIPDLLAYRRDLTGCDLLFFFEHQYHFAPPTIDLLLRRCGFELCLYAPGATHVFGVHLAARRAGDPIPPERLRPDRGWHDAALAWVRDYRRHALGQSARLRDRLAELLGPGEVGRADVVLFGAGTYAQMILEALADVRRIRAVIDNDPGKWGTTLAGIPIHPPRAIDAGADRVLVASGYRDEICEQLIGLGVPAGRVVTL